MTPVQQANVWIRKVPTWPVYAVGLLWPIWLLYLGLTGGLGVEPVRELEHRLGLLGLQVLVATLAVTPLLKFTRINLVRFRRALGQVTFWLITCHLLVWAILDVQTAGRVIADIVKRPYITIGMAAFVLMIPLAVTSFDIAIRRLGPVRWRRLHRLVYAVGVLGAVHYVMLTKTWQVEPVVYLGLIAVLLALRIPAARRRRATA
jgi:sulfoxide reductase heme-binding subunit YedZ